MDEKKKGPDMDLAKRIVGLLNELLALDAAAVAVLVNLRVPCNKSLADHPSVQVGSAQGQTFLGVLGLLNGLCGTFADGRWHGWGPVCARTAEDAGDTTSAIIGFEVTGQDAEAPTDIQPMARFFARDELQALRDRACRVASSSGLGGGWARAYVELADAADRIDALLARTEVPAPARTSATHDVPRVAHAVDTAHLISYAKDGGGVVCAVADCELNAPVKDQTEF